MTNLAGIVALAAIAAPAPAQFSDGYTFLKAVRDADGAKVDKAVKAANGAVIVNTRDGGSGETALHIVTKRRDLQYLAFLLSRGAQPDLRDNSGATPLMLATQLGWTEGMSVLLERRAQPDVASNLGETPLMRAVQNRDLAAVKLLLLAGANPKRADTGSGLTARDYAARDPRAAAILREIDAAAPRKKVLVGPN